MNTTKLIYILVAIAVIAGLLSLFTHNAAAPETTTDTDLVACTMDAKECPDGSYVGRVAPDCEFAACPAVSPPRDTTDTIVVAVPTANTFVESPLSLSGQAVGPWYFEASAPVEVRDTTGAILGQSFITAQGDWMTTDFVPFTGEVSFTVPADVTEGVIVFKKDNPSGLPEHDDELVIPVRFTQ